MALVLFSSIFIIPVLMGLGKITENLAGPLFGGISGKALSGILGISLIWTILAFFIPLNIYTEAPALLLGLTYFFKDKLYEEFYRFTKKDSLLIIIISLIIAFCSSYYPYILDHFGYYVPTIKWLTEYGLVKGIANLDLTLGQMSVWHIFLAGFSNFSDPFLRINAVLLIVYVIYTVEKRNWIQLCFLPVLLLFSQSPSPDLPVIIFSLIILNEILHGNTQITFLFGFSVFVFIIKPTMIWLPVFTFLYSVFIIKSGSKTLSFGAVIAGLFFIKNIWIFGYPVFPVSMIDLGVNWKPNPEVLKTSSEYAIQKTFDMQYSYREIQQFTWADHIRNWLFLDGIKSIIHILFIVSLVIFTGFAFIKKNKIITFLCISLLIKSVLVLFFSAQYRFFIDVFFVIFFVLFFHYFTKQKALAAFSVLIILFINFLSFPNLLMQYLPSFKPGGFMGKFEKKQLYEPSVYQYNTFSSYKIGNLKFNVSKNYIFNFDTPLPAISTGYVFDDAKAGIFPQLIDKHNIGKGFNWRKMTPEEKKEAEKIINNIKDPHQ